MKKLRLEMDDLAVESFATERKDAEGGGTVEARQLGATPICQSINICPPTENCPTSRTTICRC